MNDLKNIPVSFSTFSNNNLTSLFLFGDGNFDDTKNRKIYIYISTIKLVKNSQKFDERL